MHLTNYLFFTSLSFLQSHRRSPPRSYIDTLRASSGRETVMNAEKACLSFLGIDASLPITWQTKYTVEEWCPVYCHYQSFQITIQSLRSSWCDPKNNHTSPDLMRSIWEPRRGWYRNMDWYSFRTEARLSQGFWEKYGIVASTFRILVAWLKWSP